MGARSRGRPGPWSWPPALRSAAAREDLLALLFQRLAADEVAHEGVGRVMMQVVWRVPLRDAALLITPMRSAMAKASA